MNKIHTFHFFFLMLMLAPVAAGAQKKNRGLVTVEAQIEVLMEGNYSKAAIEQKAIQAAKIQALGQEFGYAIVQGINTQSRTQSGTNGVMTTDQMAEVSNTLVKGEWVSDQEGFPKLRYTLRDKEDRQEIWLICEVKGKARPIEEAAIDLETYAYNCDDPPRCASGQFRNHDSMFLFFRTPVKGFLSVFMLEEGLVYRLLPYAQMKDVYESAVPVEADREYRLFSPQHRTYFPGFTMVDEYGLVTPAPGQPLANLVYVVFSTQPFNKPVLQEKDGLKTLSQEDFQDWLNRNRGLDKNFQVRLFGITVNE
ncbi:MAG: hypothetical protein OHK0053_32640 [Microscillaceae bacterium]